jgi:hypothetical protein
MTEKNTTQTYYFKGLRWSNALEDFGVFGKKIQATSPQEAWTILQEKTGLKTWKNVALISIDNYYFYESI